MSLVIGWDYSSGKRNRIGCALNSVATCSQYLTRLVHNVTPSLMDAGQNIDHVLEQIHLKLH